MGVGHLDIGINRGDAQVFGPNPAIQQFGQILAQRRAKQDADHKYLADVLAQAKSDGLRNDADRTNFYSKYSALKQQAIDAENEPDRFKRAMGIANVKQGLLDLNGYADQSRKQAAIENQVGQAYIQNPTAFSDDTVDLLRRNKDLAVDHPDVVKDITRFARQPNLVKLDERIGKVKEDLLKGVQGQDIITRKRVGNRWDNQIQTKYSADPEQVAHQFLNEWDINPDFQHSLVSKYGHNIQPGLSPQQQKAALVGAFVQDLGAVERYAAKPTNSYDTQPDRFYEHQLWKLEHGAANANQLSPAQTLITNMQQGVAGSGEKLLKLVPKGLYGAAVPQVGIEPDTHLHRFDFPAQIDPKNAEYNAALRTKWAQVNPGIPFEESEGFKLKPEVIAKAKIYKLNPNSPDYVAQAAQMAAEQKIDLTKLNQIEGLKGGKGQIAAVKTPTTATSQKTTPESFNSQWAKLPKGGKLVGPDGITYTKK